MDALLERGRLVDLEPDVVIPALNRIFDQHQLVVALVAGQVADAGAPLRLDHAQNVSLEIDGGVEVGDAEGDVPDLSDHWFQLPFGGGSVEEAGEQPAGDGR